MLRSRSGPISSHDHLDVGSAREQARRTLGGVLRALVCCIRSTIATPRADSWGLRGLPPFICHSGSWSRRNWRHGRAPTSSTGSKPPASRSPRHLSRPTWPTPRFVHPVKAATPARSCFGGLIRSLPDPLPRVVAHYRPASKFSPGRRRHDVAHRKELSGNAHRRRAIHVLSSGSTPTPPPTH